MTKASTLVAALMILCTSCVGGVFEGISLNQPTYSDLDPLGVKAIKNLQTNTVPLYITTNTTIRFAKNTELKFKAFDLNGSEIDSHIRFRFGMFELNGPRAGISLTRNAWLSVYDWDMITRSRPDSDPMPEQTLPQYIEQKVKEMMPKTMVTQEDLKKYVLASDLHQGIEFDTIEVEDIKVDGKDVSLVGHTHKMSDITGFKEASTKALIDIDNAKNIDELKKTMKNFII